MAEPSAATGAANDASVQAGPTDSTASESALREARRDLEMRQEELRLRREKLVGWQQSVADAEAALVVAEARLATLEGGEG